MVTLCILYNPVLAPTTPSVCGKCFSSTFTAALVSNQTLFLCPSFSSCLYLLSPLWHLISFWVDLPLFFLVPLCIPFFLSLCTNSSLSPLPPPSFLPPRLLVLFVTTTLVYFVALCVSSLCLYSSGGEGNNVAVPSVYVPCLSCLVSLSLFLFLLSLSHTLETHLISSAMSLLHVLSWQGLI